ncbi:MAG: DUF309 domain-containing protein [Desulfosarcina sp.]|nr:DUF309 domain-containing protein [Desulfobacterales bacterium]
MKTKKSSDRRGAAGRKFDPFRDRASRDIRNTLSVAFVAAWQGEGVDYASVAAGLKERHPHPVYRAYIDQRLERYRAALQDRGELTDPGLLDDVMVLWNRHLFFEVHEYLEIDWHEARGDFREVLRTLIQAAGGYVHREAGRYQAAEKLGRRADAQLEALRPHFKAIANLDDLRRGLTEPGAAPPILRRKQS